LPVEAGLPCGPVLDTKQVLEGEHAKARGSIIEKDWYKGIRSPVRLSRTPAGLKSTPPKFSQHTREVLREHGFDDAAIERLAASGIVVEKRRTA
jgi:crotonobetainyl-CoA:carnitine CoA-transferase CaiB-like acyl-CoA transferase